MFHRNKKIIVGMSGGVDSSVALMLLKKHGFEPIGVFLKYSRWDSPKNQLLENVCCSIESFRIAREVCRIIKVPYYILDCQKDFQKIVMDYFIKISKNKMTPSPCAVCNRYLKFKKLFEFAKKHNIQYVATGHYAKTQFNKRTNQYELLKPKDAKKDQTYFLCLLTQSQIKDIIFPLADYVKGEVYQIAKEQGFGFFEKTKQSQDLCFVARKSIPDFLKDKIGLEPGAIINQNGKILGAHQGLYFYTIGQRKGLDLAQGPWRVVNYNLKNNQLIVTEDEDDKALFGKSALVGNYNFISGEPFKKPIRVMAKIRLGHKPAPAKLYPLGAGKLKIVFAKPQKAITNGQWAVFYKGKRCLGGGLIEKSELVS